jgi:hypothetical protein
MVQWWNRKKLGSASAAAYLPVWYALEAKLGGTAVKEGDMPLWEIIQRRDVAVAFTAEGDFKRTKEGGGVQLPSAVRKYLQ